MDIGTGSGKYAKLIGGRGLSITGVEINKEYIDRFKLGSLYDYLLVQDASTYFPNEVYDLVIFGDVLEHLLKSDGLNLLHFWMYKCKWLYLVVPVGYVQNVADNAESHISCWSIEEFSLFPTDTIIEQKEDKLRIIMKGYIK